MGFMGYRHIPNLYKAQDILLFRECYALEKVHGTSAHVSWNSNDIHGQKGVDFYSGGAKYTEFVKLFDTDALIASFEKLGHPLVTVYGEAYGGKLQGMSDTYGKELRFIAFDVQVGESWLSVPDAEEVAEALGFEFVPYNRVSTDIATLDFVRDLPSEVAFRRGIDETREREGVVLRPIIEMRTNDGERVMAKHKGAAFAERVNTPRVRADKLEVVAEARAIAEVWVTEMRLRHVLDKLPPCNDMSCVPQIIEAMVEDVYREARGEIVESKEARVAIGRRTAAMFKKRLEGAMRKE